MVRLLSQTAHWCSRTHWPRVLAVCAMYVCGQLLQGYGIFAPALSCLRTGSLGRTKMCRRVFIGQNVVLIPRGLRTRLMASEVSLM